MQPWEAGGQTVIADVPPDFFSFLLLLSSLSLSFRFTLYPCLALLTSRPGPVGMQNVKRPYDHVLDGRRYCRFNHRLSVPVRSLLCVCYYGTYARTYIPTVPVALLLVGSYSVCMYTCTYTRVFNTLSIHFPISFAMPLHTFIDTGIEYGHIE